MNPTIKVIEAMKAAKEQTSRLDDLYDWLYGAFVLGEAGQSAPVDQIKAALRHYESL